MDRIVIFGGYGFVGKNLLEVLDDSYEIFILSRNDDSEVSKKYQNVIHKKLDILNEQNLDKILNAIQPDFIINLISIVTAERDLEIFDSMIDSNLKTLLKIYNASKGLKSLKMLLHFGSGEEYGNTSSPFREDQREFPNSPYSLSKQLTTNTAMMLFHNFNYPVSVVRPSNIFGKYQSDNKFIPYIVKKFINNESISTTKCEQKRDFIDANTLSSIVKKMIEKYQDCVGEIFNISSGKSNNLKEIILYCKEKCNSSSTINFGEIPYRENEIMDFVLDNRKIVNTLNITLEYDLFEKLNEYIQITKG